MGYFCSLKTKPFSANESSDSGRYRKPTIKRNYIAMEKNEPNQPLTAAENDGANLLARAKANSKLILALSIFILAVIIGLLAWFFVSQTGSKRADEAIAKADIEQNDSTALALYKEAAEHGYKSGNRARLEVATRLYEQGKYEEALTYLDKCSFSDHIVKSGALALAGDCYVNLKNYPDALTAFDKAISAADKNPTIVPLLLIKKANIFRHEKNYTAEYESLKTIIDEYPQFVQSTQTDVRRMYERAKAAAGE